jgi:hypothetical protein
MKPGVTVRVAVVATLLALSVAQAQDLSVQKIVGTWKGKVELLDELERTLVIKSVTRVGSIGIASVEYGPTSQKLDAFEGRVEKQRGATILTFAISTTRKVELSLVSDTELRGWLKVSDGAGSWVGRKMRLQKESAKP